VNRYGLTDEQLAAIAALRTVKREYATAFLCNGVRGSGTISIRVSPIEYWIATSDPVRDEPLRRQALAEAGGDPWRALRVLCSGGWRERVEIGERGLREGRSGTEGG
jgi:hypothetical protein